MRSMSIIITFMHPISILLKNFGQLRVFIFYLRRWDMSSFFGSNSNMNNVHIYETWHILHWRDSSYILDFWIGESHSWISKSTKYTPLDQVSSFYHRHRNLDRFPLITKDAISLNSRNKLPLKIATNLFPNYILLIQLFFWLEKRKVLEVFIFTQEFTEFV